VCLGTIPKTHTQSVARERVVVGAAGDEDRVRARSVRTSVRGSGPTANAVVKLRSQLALWCLLTQRKLTLPIFANAKRSR
jgi:hypothetical protein